MWSWAAVLAPPHREHPWPQRVNHFSSCPAGSTHFRGVRNAPPRASALPFCLLRQVGWLRTRPVARLLQATRVPCLSSRTRGKIQNLATEGPASPTELRHRHWKEAAAPLATSTTGRVHPSLPHPSFLLTHFSTTAQTPATSQRLHVPGTAATEEETEAPRGPETCSGSHGGDFLALSPDAQSLLFAQSDTCSSRTLHGSAPFPHLTPTTQHSILLH